MYREPTYRRRARLRIGAGGRVDHDIRPHELSNDLAGWIADDQPREMSHDDGEQRRFWQGVRASPAQSARDIRSRFRDIDRRLGDIEYFVTSENRSLAKEIEELR